MVVIREGDRRRDSAVRSEDGEHQGEQQEEIEQRENMRRRGEEQEGESSGERRRKNGFIGSIQWCYRKYLLQGGPVVDCAVVAACTAIVNFILPMAGASSNDLLGTKKKTIQLLMDGGRLLSQMAGIECCPGAASIYVWIHRCTLLTVWLCMTTPHLCLVAGLSHTWGSCPRLSCAC